ncbi:hypothetical protein O4160_03450 [Rhodococcus sp. IEGM 1401]|uniref:hypothetical protein n=1 Tax=unclassified Rhodococcus (in: high G+C Gram-positive bacteria) TaxID=192944 RepID=UPI0022B2AE32|nr:MULTISPECIES: hypothetical protein [unclassified Rhodococcus (in: high G+C Gram-positive bacteria)]MCZ4559887.1 hypothetical protein [Rhodococcus sp. IEGM 1401]MDI9920069.1 hypothetical protein [Rhodococcus sp. IEGM 1372]MDV8032468.1 hypothetical protein [Rhodococcus sp. IEGM 1414]
MNLKNSHDTPSGYLDAMENALLDATATLRAMRVAPSVDVPASVMFGGSFDEWRNVEFENVTEFETVEFEGIAEQVPLNGTPTNPPTFEAPASSYAATENDESVIAEAVETMLRAAMAAPHTAEVGTALVRCIDLLQRRWTAHRLAGAVGMLERNHAELVADDAFTRNYDFALLVVTHPYVREQAA